jgi:hypothetical protein
MADRLPDPSWDPAAALSALEMETRVHGEGEKPIDQAKRLIDENLPLATASVIHLALHGQNENQRFQAARYLMDRGLGKVTDQGTSVEGGDPIERLLQDVLGNSDTK